MVFGNKLEKLTGAIFSQLIALSQMDRMNIPRPILALKNQMRKIEVALTTRAMKTGMINYKLVDCDELNTKKRSRDEGQGSKLTIQLNQTDAN